uniref:Uncharacterized protein n=1 Tax=Setaria italica TaxID=4555 RepID=K3Y4G6_SETIT
MPMVTVPEDLQKQALLQVLCGGYTSMGGTEEIKVVYENKFERQADPSPIHHRTEFRSQSQMSATSLRLPRRPRQLIHQSVPFPASRTHVHAAESHK